MSEGRQFFADIFSILTIVLSFFLSLQPFYLLGWFDNAFDFPEDSGGWFFAYQNLFTGILAFLRGCLAYYGVIKSISWQEGLIKKDFNKLEQDFLEDCRHAIFIIMTIDALIRENFVQEAKKFMETQVPVELGFKFFNRSALDKLSGHKRQNVRGIIRSVGKFNAAIKDENYKKAYDASFEFYVDCKNMFGDDFCKIEDLCVQLVKVLGEKRKT